MTTVTFSFNARPWLQSGPHFKQL